MTRLSCPLVSKMPLVLLPEQCPWSQGIGRRIPEGVCGRSQYPQRELGGPPSTPGSRVRQVKGSKPETESREVLFCC